MHPEARIAHYRVTAKLGEGGMGEVWRATDTKLGREVAIKVLPEALAGDADRMARFAREAQVLASLNHPNIAAIYGVEDRALVMELVEGSTLAERIALGPLPLDEALPIARQIAEALEYAHEKGVVHRDLKPANIKITPDGRVKVLDFGLAKALANDSTISDPASSPTLTMRATMAGLIMGTAGYMSPEQAKGKPVDRRADIWAFGVVLAEMLTGRVMYTGETVSEILADVIKSPPVIPDGAPAHITKLLRRCLDKDPKLRLQAIGEARIALDRVEEEALPAAAAVSLPSKSPWLPGVLASVLLIAAGVLGVLLWRAYQPVSRPMQRFAVYLGPDAVRGRYSVAAISPDGNRIVYFVQSGSAFQLATRLLDQAAATPLPGTENADQPFFSPDSQWIGFFADQKLKKVSVMGGAAVTLCETIAPPRGATWTEDGSIIANIDNQHLVRVSAAGGAPVLIGKPEEHNQRTWRWPQIVDKQQLVFITGALSYGGYEDADIVVLNLKTGKAKTVHRGGYFPRYLPTGHLVYVRQGTLFGVRFDINRLEVQGTPIPILEGVAGMQAQGAGEFDFSKTGTFLYLSGDGPKSAWNGSWIDGRGKVQTIWSSVSAPVSPKISPDGGRVVANMAGDIYVYDTGRAAATRLTFNPAYRHNGAIWTLDGKYIAYSSTEQQQEWIWLKRADGSGQAQKLLSMRGGAFPVAWSFSPDGKRMAFSQRHQNNFTEIWMLPMDWADPNQPKPGTPELFLGEPAGQSEPAFSPDGRWIAYTSFENQPQVFVRPAKGGSSGGRWQISNHSGRFPVWSRTGHELLYVGADNYLMSVDWDAKGDSFAPGKPKRWSATTITRFGNSSSFDLAPDGKRVFAFPLTDSPDAEKGTVRVTVLLNFFDELKRSLP